jgi:hypothetical protein
VLAFGVVELRLRERDVSLADRVAFGGVERARLRETVVRVVHLAEQQRGAATLRERPRLLGAHAERGEGRGDALVNLRGLGGEVEFEVGVGDLHLGDGRLVRHAERGVAAARAFEQIERAVVAPLREREVTHVAFDLGERHVEAGGLGDGERLPVELVGGAEFVEERVRVGEAVVDLGELVAVVERGEAFARERLEFFGLAVAVAAEVDVADVVLDLAGG